MSQQGRLLEDLEMFEQEPKPDPQLAEGMEDFFDIEEYTEIMSYGKQIKIDTLDNHKLARSFLDKYEISLKRD